MVNPEGRGEKGFRSVRPRRRVLTAAALSLAVLLAPGCSADSDEPTDTSGATTTIAPSTTEAVTEVPPIDPSTVLLPGEEHVEVQQFGAHVFTDYYNASGMGPRLPIDAVIVVDCFEPGNDIVPSVGRGGWYHVISDALNGSEVIDSVAGRYVAANTFRNGPLEEENPRDPAVPACP